MERLTSGDFTEEDEPFALFAELAGRGRASPSRTTPTPWRSRPSTPTGLPNCPHGAAEGPRARTASCSTPTSRARRAAGTARPGPRRPRSSTGRACAGRSASAAPSSLVSRRRGRRLFPAPPARQPHRRLGLAAVAPAGEPLLRSRRRSRRYAAKYGIGDGPAPAATGAGFRIDAGLDRVLARRRVPPARPHRLPPRRGRRAVDARCGSTPEDRPTMAMPKFDFPKTEAGSARSCC